MSKDHTSDNRNMEYLRVLRTPHIVASSLTGGLLSASRIKRDTPGHGMTDDHVLEDAFMLSLQKRDYQGAMWVDGKKVDFRGSRQGNFTLYDYSRVWRADLQSPFDCTNFYISRRALYSLEEEIGTKPLEGFNVAPGADIDDPVVHNIVNALIPIFDGRFDTNQLLLDYVGTGLLVHLASTYGSIHRQSHIRRGGLTPMQLNRATALLDGNLHGRLNLSDIARECGLSSSYFARAFKVSTGGTPHRWLAQRRLDKASDLLRNSSITLKEIAIACGFSDQAHFSRTFSKAKGMPPAAWRRNIILTPSFSMHQVSPKFRPD
ncbi:AraC family transcriptional regulator [Rhizobium sp. SG570]|uniref:helix-turn-helix domain-containing protein n=1 Tax=Rhizobium sp. SG570 TaxID=2587113 RepID=UPI0018558A22|nr:AraC family transcriptional regulator [Rhizobium sp. SG570]NKJ36460.1 AraC-like DNA-binding protein [Rhizobium sp. SG570]